MITMLEPEEMAFAGVLVDDRDLDRAAVGGGVVLQVGRPRRGPHRAQRRRRGDSSPPTHTLGHWARHRGDTARRVLAALKNHDATNLMAITPRSSWPWVRNPPTIRLEPLTAARERLDGGRRSNSRPREDHVRKVVHFEIPAEDLERAKGFYASIFGWQLHTMPMAGGEYATVVTTPVDEQTQMPTEPGRSTAA